MRHISIITVLVDLSDGLVGQQLADDVLPMEVSGAAWVLGISIEQLHQHDSLFHVSRGVAESNKDWFERLVSIGTHQFDDAFL